MREVRPRADLVPRRKAHEPAITNDSVSKNQGSNRSESVMSPPPLSRFVPGGSPCYNPVLDVAERADEVACYDSATVRKEDAKYARHGNISNTRKLRPPDQRNVTTMTRQDSKTAAARNASFDRLDLGGVS